MAIVHQASITPSKQELLDGLLGGPVEIVGTYRFDDPAGEVGVEGFVVRQGDQLRHTVLTYRGAPLEGAEAHLVSTMEHSVLGTRWVYAGAADPVALGCFDRALAGGQEQAVLEIWADGTLVGTREPSIRVTRTGGPSLLATWAGGELVIATKEGLA